MTQYVNLKEWGSWCVKKDSLIEISGTSVPAFNVGPFPYNVMVSLGRNGKASIRVKAGRS